MSTYDILSEIVMDGLLIMFAVVFIIRYKSIKMQRALKITDPLKSKKFERKYQTIVKIYILITIIFAILCIIVSIQKYNDALTEWAILGRNICLLVWCGFGTWFILKQKKLTKIE